MSPDATRDFARKQLADSFREMRRSAYGLSEDQRFIGHWVARSMWREYRAKRDAQGRAMLAEGLKDGQALN